MLPNPLSILVIIRGVSIHSPTDVGSHNLLTLEPERPRWHTSRCVALILFVPLSNRCGISQSTLFRGSMFSLAHHSMFGSNTICNVCNNPSPLHTDIVYFGPLRYHPHNFKTRLLERDLHMSVTLIMSWITHVLPNPLSILGYYKECFDPLSNWCGISQSTLFRGRMSRWHTARCVALILFIPLSNRCGISQSTLFRRSMSSLAHHSVVGSNTICKVCNNSSPLHTDIVYFDPLRIAIIPTILKRVC